MPSGNLPVPGELGRATAVGAGPVGRARPVKLVGCDSTQRKSTAGQ